MIEDLYQHYLYVIGKLKDVHSLHVEVDHKDIHTFFAGKIPVFKLLFGTYNETEGKSIVVSFHIELPTVAAIQWYLNIAHVHPPVILSNVYFEDFAGDIYYGEDAVNLLNLKRDQECLDEYLEVLDKEEMKEFVKSKVIGRELEPNPIFTSVNTEAALEAFNQMKKPIDDDEVQ